MGAQFGRFVFHSDTKTRGDLSCAEALIAPYGPDQGSSYSGAGIDIQYRAFQTTKASTREVQPFVSVSGRVLTFDGRLDNRAELVRQLGQALPEDVSDVAIAAAAYERWSTNSFARLLGDWALSIWDPTERAIVLAKDFAGSRHLYYALDDCSLTWSTIIDPLVILARRRLTLDEEYIAGWLGLFPDAALTPFKEIRSVRPCCFVTVSDRGVSIHKYWTLDSKNEIRHRTDQEYEEQFRWFFRQSVRRRLRSHFPILAELSGGIDSSSIVCMADTILRKEESGETPRLDTLSYFNNQEPNWDETPYFQVVERLRGREGFHIEVGKETHIFTEGPGDRLPATPARQRFHTTSDRLTAHLRSNGYRVLLSGVGGDELLGGIPTPVPELGNLFVSGRWVRLANRLIAWSIASRRPATLLMAQTLQPFLPIRMHTSKVCNRSHPWLAADFVKRQSWALNGYPERWKLPGPPPGVQTNLAALHALQRQLACTPISDEPVYEKRYPYLDRDLFEFLCLIPREQVVRPQARRSLQRRALAGIVPIEVLARRRKAFVVRSLMQFLSSELGRLTQDKQPLLGVQMGIVVEQGLLETAKRLSSGQEIPVISLMRTIALENWLRGVTTRNLADLPSGRHRRPPTTERQSGERMHAHANSAGQLSQ